MPQAPHLVMHRHSRALWPLPQSAPGQPATPPARHGRGRKQHHVAQESRFCRPLVAGLILCHAKVKRGPYTSSYFYDSGGEKVVGWEGQTKLRY